MTLKEQIKKAKEEYRKKMIQKNPSWNKKYKKSQKSQRENGNRSI